MLPLGGLKRALKAWLVGWLKHGATTALLHWRGKYSKPRETEIPEWIYHIRLAPLPGRVTSIVRKKSVRRGTDSLKTSVVALLRLSEITLGMLLLSWDPSMQWE